MTLAPNSLITLHLIIFVKGLLQQLSSLIIIVIIIIIIIIINNDNDNIAAHNKEHVTINLYV